MEETLLTLENIIEENEPLWCTFTCGVSGIIDN